MRTAHWPEPGHKAATTDTEYSSRPRTRAVPSDPAAARRRAVTLLLLSLVVPGSAQLVAGNRLLGRVMLRMWLMLLALVGLLVGLALLSTKGLVSLAAQGWFLTGVQWLLFIFAALWAVVLVDAWRLGRPDRQPAPVRRWLVGGLAVLLVLVPGGIVYAGTSVGAGRDALAAVFGTGPSAESTEGRYNILLLGGDSGAGRAGTRPDSLQVVSIDEDTGRAVTLGFARDTEDIIFEPGSVMAGLMPEGWTCGADCLLNGLYTWAWDHEDQFPAGTEDPGILATREAVEALSGLDMHYYALVDINGFRSLIDALGGLEITVMRRTPIGGGTSPVFAHIEPGTQRLDGYHALWYARSRTGSSNYERMARQRCVMAAMVDQVDPRTLALGFGDIAAASTGVLRTDIPQSELGSFAELALKTRSQKITGVNFVPPLLKPWDYDQDEMHRLVQDAITASEKTPDEDAVSQSAAPIPTPGTESTDISPATPQAETDEPPPAETPSVDPLARPSEDANAQTDDIASVCSVG